MPKRISRDELRVRKLWSSLCKAKKQPFRGVLKQGQLLYGYNLHKGCRF